MRNEQNMSTNSSKYQREFMLEFIDLYRSLPALWKVKSKDYSDRRRKRQAYDILIQKYKEVSISADREFIKKKINSLRTNYRKQLRRVEAQKLANKPLTPTWCYQDLSFLKDSLADEQLEEGVHEEQISSTKLSKSSNDLRLGNFESLSDQEKLPKVSLGDQFSNDKEDEYETLAESWAFELKKMEVDQQICAKKAIYNILFQGQLGKLIQESSAVSTSLVLPLSDCVFPNNDGDGSS